MIEVAFCAVMSEPSGRYLGPAREAILGNRVVEMADVVPFFA